VPLASLPAEIAGRNRMIRKMILDSIRQDPAWQNGEYREQPPGLIGAIHMMIIMGSCPLQWQAEAPTRAAADQFLAKHIETYRSRLDANDMLYQVGASEDYDPAPGLSRITAPLLAINSADDQVNPPELGILEAAIKRVRRGRHILLPIDERTRGHGTHTLAGIWKQHLADFLGA
jgi:homoserine O-acetyltransferase